MNIAMETHALCRDLPFIHIIDRMSSWSPKKYFIQVLGEREAGRAKGLLLWAGARPVLPGRAQALPTAMCGPSQVAPHEPGLE